MGHEQCGYASYDAVGGPHQVVRASRRPWSVPSPTHATWPSGRIKTAVGAETAPNTGSSHTPAYRASICRTRSAHGVRSKAPGAPRLRDWTSAAPWSLPARCGGRTQTQMTSAARGRASVMRRGGRI